MVADFQTFSRLAGFAASERAWPEGGGIPQVSRLSPATRVTWMTLTRGNVGSMMTASLPGSPVPSKRPMNQQSSTVFTSRDLENARERGALAGEVRVLKWGAGIAIVAILGGLGMLYQNQIVLHQRVVQVEERVVRVEEHLVRVEERVARVEEHLVRVEERVARVEERLDSIDKHLATISAQLATLTSRQIHSP